jgi:cell wall-associated NlpC family hydrolase
MAATDYGTAIAQYAESFSGKIPYKLNASTLDLSKVSAGATNFVADCSLFVQKVFADAGISLPRNAAAQYKQTEKQTVATTPDTSKLQPGDLLFFGGWNEPNNPPGYGGVQHVAIYAGNGMVVDEGGANPNNVGVTSLSSYSGHFIAATRMPATSQTVQPGSNPVSDFVGSVQNGIGVIISGASGIALDIAAYAGVAALALVLIIGGVILLRPQSS